MTPAEREASREAARRAVDRAPKLTAEDVTKLRALLGGPRPNPAAQAEGGAA